MRIFACALPPILFCLGGGGCMLPLAVAVVLHECAHLAALRLCGGRLRDFCAAPFGLCLVLDEGTLSLGGEAIVCAAGCFANLLCAGFAFAAYALFSVDLLLLGTVNLLTALLNLLPMPPLDGARLLFLLLSARRDPMFAGRAVAILGYALSMLVFLFSSYLLLTTGEGMYALLFSVYVFSASSRQLAGKARI